MNSLVLNTKVRRYARDYSSSIVITASSWGEDVAKWVWPWLQMICTASSAQALSSTVWDALKPALSMLQDLPCWTEISVNPLCRLEPEQLASLLSDWEDALLDEFGASRASRISILLRGYLYKFLEAANPGGRAATARRRYKTKLTRPPQTGRGLISDHIGYDADGKALPPIGALRHESMSDLKRQFQSRLNGDLQLVLNACEKELDAYDEQMRRLKELRAKKLPKGFAAQIGERIASRRRTGWEPSDLDRKNLIVLYLKVVEGELELPTFCERGTYLYANSLAPQLCAALGIQKTRFDIPIHLDIHPPASVLVACALIIQAKTRWNISSVLDLSSKDRHLSQPPFQIQSVKSKTGDETPPVLVEAKDVLVIRALNLLESRLRLLKKRGIVKEHILMLWVSRRREFSTGETIQLSNWCFLLHRFQSNHALPNFSFEQVRDQALHLLSMEKGGLIAAMESAGHANLSTLTTYVQNAISERQSQATNLEFQRRWDASIRYRMDPSSVAQGERLIPIGDGSMCISPTKPPDESWLTFGICTAKECHKAEGCTNRRLVIDMERIEEAIRTNAFYTENWQSLLSRNADAFIAQHLPAMLFNIALLAAIRRGPYKHLVPA